MIPIMHWYTLWNPLLNIPGSYHKKTTFVIGNNVGPLDYIIYVTKTTQLSLIEKKNGTLYSEFGFFSFSENMKRPLKYMKASYTDSLNQKCYTIYNIDRCIVFNN